MNKGMKVVGEWLAALSFAVVLAIVIGIFIVQPSIVSGHSMDPTLENGQRIYVSKLSHTFNYVPDYGDIVIIDSRVDRKRSLADDLFEHPLFMLLGLGNKEDQYVYVKRVIGKPGDILEFKNNQVYRNGDPLDEPYIMETMATDDRVFNVPEGHVFVLGDNRNESADSRELGYIPLSHILGKKISWN
ncbi:signal peptidase I [Numidum massiliense]|uniref:signal peptidase I n=1 Tax=Numidum massiliense TaxID=1522315 RepID=UPI0006D53FEC|nr:signal peptidase I [Numidum massiliense]